MIRVAQNRGYRRRRVSASCQVSVSPEPRQNFDNTERKQSQDRRIQQLLDNITGESSPKIPDNPGMDAIFFAGTRTDTELDCIPSNGSILKLIWEARYCLAENGEERRGIYLSFADYEVLVNELHFSFPGYDVKTGEITNVYGIPFFKGHRWRDGNTISYILGNTKAFRL